MTKNDVLGKLNEGTVSISFIKANGETRDMSATLDKSIVNYPETKTGQSRKLNESVQSVWDSGVSGWRSFRWDSVRSVDGVATPSGIVK